MILAILITLATAPAPRDPSCVQVRAYVEMYGEAAAVSHARRQGFTQADIERIKRRCLPR